MQAEKCKLYDRAWHGNEKKHSSHYTVISSCALYRSFSGKVKKVLGIWWSEYCRKFLSEIWELCRAYHCQKQPTETHMVSTEAVVFSAQGQLKFQVFPFSPVQWTLCLGAIFCVNWCTPRTQGPSHENTGLINLKEEKRTIYHGKYFLRRWANICFKIIRGIFFLFFGLFGFFVPRHWPLQEVQIAHHVRDMHKLVGTLMPGGKQTTARGLEREREREKLHKDKHVSPSVA